MPRGKLRLLVCDMDGTLLDSRSRLSAGNERALASFVSRGGMFTVATGRCPPAIEPYLPRLPINVPAIILNGSVLYDFASGRTLWERVLPISARDPIAACLERFPEMGVEIYHGDHCFLVRSSPETEAHIAREMIGAIPASFEEVPLPWRKVLFMWNPEALTMVHERLGRMALPFRSTFSGAQSLELLAWEASKGDCLIRLADLLGVPLSEVAAVGDNLNDIEMIEVAGMGVAVANAHPRLKAVAEYRALRHDDDSIADLLERLA